MAQMHFMVIIGLIVVLLFAAIFYALKRKSYVRATFKSPFAAFLVEFEADDREHDSKH